MKSRDKRGMYKQGVEKFENFPTSAENQSSLEVSLSMLKDTEGYVRMSVKQQKMMETSLRIQERKDSMRSPWSKRRTERVVREWFCFYSVRCLEREEVFNFAAYKKLMAQGRKHEFWGDFFESVYWREGRVGEGVLKELEFPQVLYIGRKPDEPGYSEGFVWNSHAGVILGRDASDNFLVWEKVAEKQPFLLTGIQDVLNRYPDADRYALRPLRDKKK